MTVRAQGWSFSHLLLEYTVPQGVMQAGVGASRSKGWRSWERASVVSVGHLGVPGGSSAPRERAISPQGSWGRRPGRCALLHPREQAPPSLPLVPAGRGQFNSLHLFSCRQILCCWQRVGEHLPGSQSGSLPSLTDIGITMGRDAHDPASHASPIPRSMHKACGRVECQGQPGPEAQECISHRTLPLSTVDCHSIARLHPRQCGSGRAQCQRASLPFLVCHSTTPLPRSPLAGTAWGSYPPPWPTPLGSRPGRNY